jgi:hypothetical protein
MVSSISGSEGDIFLLFEGDRFLLGEDARPLKWQKFQRNGGPRSAQRCCSHPGRLTHLGRARQPERRGLFSSQCLRDHYPRYTFLMPSAHIYLHLRCQPLSMPHSLPTLKPYTTSLSSTSSHFCPTSISVRFRRLTATAHDCPSTTRYITHSSREPHFCAVALNIRDIFF